MGMFTLLLLLCLCPYLTQCVNDDISTNGNQVNVPTTTVSKTTTTTTSASISAYMPSPAGTCTYDFASGANVPADDVFIIDRSSSVNKDQFDYGKEFIKSLILKRFILSSEKNRIAIISVAKEVVKHVDYVSDDDDDDVAAECEFFHPGGVFDGIQYDNDVAHMGSKSLTKILYDATEILKASRRTSVKRIWLISDFHGFSDAPHYTDISRLIDGIQIYGVGANVHAREEKELIHERFCNLTKGTTICGCQYRYVTDQSQPELSWMGVVESLDTVTEKDSPERSDFVKVTSESVCQSHDYSCTDTCYCRQYLTSHDSVTCRNSDNDDFDDDEGDDGLSTVTYILIALVVILVLVVIVLTSALGYTQWRSKGQTQNKPPLPYFPSVKSVTTTTSDLSYEIEGYLVPSTWYNPNKYSNISRRNSEGDLNTTTNPNEHNDVLQKVVNVDEIIYQPTHKYINVDISDDFAGEGSSENINGSFDSGVVTNSIDRRQKHRVKSGIDNTLYQITGDTKSVVKPKTKLFIKNKQQQQRQKSVISPAECDIISPSHTYHEIIEPNNNSTKSHKRKSSHPYVEIVPRNSNYEPVVIKFNAPPSSHSYEKFCFPTKLNDLSKSNDDYSEARYCGTVNSSDQLTQKQEDKKCNLMQEKSIRMGDKRVKDIANMFTENKL